MRILIFGAGGQIGTELIRCARPAGVEALAASRETCDLTIEGGARALILASGCDAVINAAAYTAVDKAETEPALARTLNAAAPGEVAQTCAERSIPLVHFSTDYVFDGAAAQPYRETDETAPTGVYGATKLEGEERVAAARGVHAILRTSWVFSAHGANFVKTMLRLARERDVVKVVADQLGKPTPASAAAAAALIVARALVDEPARSGVYHFAGDEAATWADFAAEIFKRSGGRASVQEIATADYPTPARRPAYSVLDTQKISDTFGVGAPSWRDGLKDALTALGARKPAEAAS